ncbi:MAG: hypothetical protein RSE41_01055 [Clostridia bacterium]
MLKLKPLHKLFKDKEFLNNLSKMSTKDQKNHILQISYLMDKDIILENEVYTSKNYINASIINDVVSFFDIKLPIYYFDIIKTHNKLSIQDALVEKTINLNTFEPVYYIKFKMSNQDTFKGISLESYKSLEDATDALNKHLNNSNPFTHIYNKGKYYVCSKKITSI